jgi:hypothetical protein
VIQISIWRFLAPKSRRRRFQNDTAFFGASRLFEKNRLLAMSRGNIITGLTFSRHSCGVSGTFLYLVPCTLSYLYRPDLFTTTQTCFSNCSLRSFPQASVLSLSTPIACTAIAIYVTSARKTRRKYNNR